MSIMPRSLVVALAVVFTTCAGLAPEPAQASHITKASLVAAAATAAPAVPKIDPATMSLLKKTSDILAHAKSLSFKTQVLREEAATTGQMLDFYSTTTVAMVRPNQLTTATTGDVRSLSLWFDGTTLSLYDPTRNVFAQVPAAGDTDSVIRVIADKVRAPLPVALLLLSDPYGQESGGIQEAFNAGQVRVAGSVCEHLVFREADSDWQLWISDGAQPLPLRLAIMYKNIPGQPRVIVSFSDWKLDPTLASSMFVFQKPAGATAIKVKLYQ